VVRLEIDARFGSLRHAEPPLATSADRAFHSSAARPRTVYRDRGIPRGAAPSLPLACVTVVTRSPRGSPEPYAVAVGVAVGGGSMVAAQDEPLAGAPSIWAI